MDSSASDQLEKDAALVSPPTAGAKEAPAGGVARHRRHRFPGRTESVRARYDSGELAAVAAAADRAGLTTSGYVAAAATGSAPPEASGERELLGEVLQVRLAVRRDAVNVNQAVAALHSGAGGAGVAAAGGRRLRSGGQSDG